ncbi:MAG: flagellar basal body P-ring formation chaperone FlgA [Rubricella sp.]
MVRAFVLLLLASSLPAHAGPVEPLRIIRAQEVIGPGDVTVGAGPVPPGAAGMEDVLGQEARRPLYPGRAILSTDVEPAAIVERNGTVTILFRHGPLTIQSVGIALERGRVGETIRLLNSESRATIHGSVLPDGRVEVTR